MELAERPELDKSKFKTIELAGGKGNALEFVS